MKDYKERTDSIRTKLKTAKRKRNIVISVVSMCCCVALLVGVLLIPKGTSEPTKTNYTVKSGTQGYEPLIARLSALMGPMYDDDLLLEDVPTMAPGAAMPDGAPNEGNNKYEEVTDNQVAGVTEADLFKRSDKHIFYLRGNTLTAYSIAGEASRELDSLEIGSTLGERYRVYDYDLEMYLSEDCRTVTVIGKCYDQDEQRLYLYLESLDVSAPEDIRVRGNQFITGSYNTSRLMGEELYVISRLYVPYNVDFSDESTFLPGYGRPGDLEYLEMERICLPENTNSAMYTVVTKLNCEDLEVVDTLAVLSANGGVYVSQDNIYLTGSYWVKTGQNRIAERQVTDITRINLQETGLELEGTVQVDGTLKDQYSMDEYQGVLRVVTTLSQIQYEVEVDGISTSVMLAESRTNAGLYCIDLADHSLRAKVEWFAPEGESVRSVRFDGDKAYVCTAVALMDPVFFFDLSDLDHISVKDTGTIDGFSMSLVDFVDGFLMGIGYGESVQTLKVEIYREGAASVESHCVFERYAAFSDEYKSYLIDRENRLVGLGIYDHSGAGGSRYLLLHFDGYALNEVLDVAYDGDPYSSRAVYIDGYLYLLGDGLTVHWAG